MAGLVCAVVALCVAFWMWRDKEKEGDGARTWGQSQVAKPYLRDRNRREIRERNPREEFERARERGLTEEEVRSVVGQFVALGVATRWHEGTTVEKYVELGDRARKWYRDLLVEGFGLTSEQKIELAARIRELGKSDLEDFNEEIAQYQADAKRWEAVNPEARPIAINEMFESGPLIQKHFGLWRDEYAPQRLLDLDESQNGIIGCFDESGVWVWVSGTQRTLDYGTTVCYWALTDPFTEGGSLLYEVGKIFPLSMRQVDHLRQYEYDGASPCSSTVIAGGGPLRQVECLTAPQLMTLLLFRPEMAETLMKELGE